MTPTEPLPSDPEPATQKTRWQKPVVEVISLACEISAYAPAEDGPLF